MLPPMEAAAVCSLLIANKTDVRQPSSRRCLSVASGQLRAGHIFVSFPAPDRRPAINDTSNSSGSSSHHCGAHWIKVRALKVGALWL